MTCWEKAFTSLEIILAAELEQDAEKDDGQSGNPPGCQRLSEQSADTNIDEDLAGVDQRADEGEGGGGETVVVEDTTGLVTQQAAEVSGTPHQAEEIRAQTGVPVLDWRRQIFHQGVS